MQREARTLSSAARLAPLGLALATFWAAAAAAEPSRESQEAPAVTAPEEPVEVTPPGEWLTDETGEEYRVEKIPKVEGAYKWIDDQENEVLLPLGARLEVLRHDDTSFWVKYLKPHPLVKRKPKPKGPTPEELEALAKRYYFELEKVDRLQFEEFGRGLPRVGQWRNGLDVVDMNGDGHLDIVFGPARKGRMVPNIFLGDSAGNWVPWNDARFPEAPYDYGDVEAADFNGDGHMDLAFGIHLRGMLVLVGDGKGGFSKWSDGIGLGHPGRGGDDSAFSSRAVESADWNGDGKLDIVAFGEGPKGTGGQKQAGLPQGVNDSSRGILVYLNKGDGAWQAWRPVVGENPRANFGDSFVLADFNKDGLYDLATVSRQMGSKEVLRIGTELGKFRTALIDDLPKGGLVTAVASGDVNGDQHDDLVLGFIGREAGVWLTGVDLFYGAADLTWKRRALFNEESRRGITSLALGQLDGDGRLDLVALSGRGETLVFLGDGQGGFAQEDEQLTPSEMGCQGYGLALVDLDGDGRDEVVASFAGETTGMPGLPGLSHPGCRNEGSLRAWKARPAPSS